MNLDQKSTPKTKNELEKALSQTIESLGEINKAVIAATEKLHEQRRIIHNLLLEVDKL